ncbi:Glyoxylate pathway regulator [Wickerhamomyces ciferrii]|uniref:Glyoxylate pathway regulator n=1 Tax=Wickerhamomyces ciferrii (strain ATCC 14091 / BCRC 22168 / CBS 111 / JCM 3599 / NBRC 0793 / NRRL Y-1031 F-60-10) TaxID=1206466 RepID=K0KI48_WICCF|nr:Glyoxylate pathway regulator [Wickerhamomyces ciferrii]CCH42686.1 Glyoxylate pathway regulator [Wickerhamomyces ciferrii]
MSQQYNHSSDLSDTEKQSPPIHKESQTPTYNSGSYSQNSNSYQHDLGTGTIQPKHYEDHEVHPINTEVSRIQTSGNNNEYIMIGRTKVLKSELVDAFGGTLNPGISAPSTHKFANPAPLGLCGFALTTFMLSMYNSQAMGIKVPNVVVGSAFFYGGVCQLLAGMWEIALENTFGGTALSSYGGFWLSYAAINIKWFGVKDAFEDETELANAIGFFLLGWAIFTFGLVLCTLKSTLAFFSLFFFLDITFILLSIGEFTGSVGVTRAGGVFGVITSFIAWYNAFAGIANRENSYFTAKVIPLPHAKSRIEKS